MSRIFDDAPIIVLGGAIVLILLLAMWLGRRLQLRLAALLAREDGTPPADEAFQNHILSAVMGLLALLMGFTFALAIDRFDSRRQLVVAEANSIGTTWLRARLLDEPHRSRLLALLEDYARNRIALAEAQDRGDIDRLLAESGRLQDQLWNETEAAVRPMRNVAFAASFLETMNQTIDLGAERKVARQAHVPPEVLAILLIYLVVVAFVYGYNITGARRWAASTCLLALFTLAYLLILDLDRPNRGGIRESQAPMEDLLQSMHGNPPPTLAEPPAAPGG
jgi:hypothetical protein